MDADPPRGPCDGELVRRFMKAVMAGLVPATPLTEALPCHMIGVAGTSPAMTVDDSRHPNMH
jgi:hypothetical protein